MNINETSTIAAIATPAGTGGIGIIRISGPHTLHIIQTIFKLKDSNQTPILKFEHRKIYVGFILDTYHNRFIDEAIVFYMRAPHSYTCEDLAEIQVHGSSVILHMVLELILSLGVTLAQPGEFTKRAFFNGRIDLIQAESIIDLMLAQSRSAVTLSTSLLKGDLGFSFQRIKNELLYLLSYINADIDFPEEDIPIISNDIFIHRIGMLISDEIKPLINNYQEKRYLKEGVKIGIAGPPNVGKSSLLNCLLKKDRSIVTSIPGTTRDIIEETFFLNGIPLIISDTAGLHETLDPVESIGISKAKRHLKESDVILFVIDSSKKIGSDEKKIYDYLNKKKIILVLNKIDIQSKHSTTDTKFFQNVVDIVAISAKYQQGISELRKAIFKAIHLTPNESINAVVPNLRQSMGLKFIEKRLFDAIENLKQFQPIELIAIDLQSALDKIDEVTGVDTPVDIFDMIFNHFCIGK